MRKLSICLVAVSLLAAAPPAPEPGPIATRIDALANLFTELAMFDGVVLLAKDGEVVFEKSYGQANYELGVPNRPESRFRVASLSKAITKVAIGKLWESGKLTPDTSLAKFVPEYAPAPKITLRQLLDHRAGVPHLNAQPWYEERSRHHNELEELLERIAGLPLDFEPGEKVSYSNGGYALLALVIERASGLSYGEFLRREVLDPLGLTSTGHERHGELVPMRSSGYLPGPIAGRRAPAQYVEPSIKIGGGSLYSTVRDWLKFDRALFTDTLLRRETWEALFTVKDGGVWMTGRAPGYYASHRRLLDEDWTLIAFANNYSVHPFDDFLPALLGKEPFRLPAHRTDLGLPSDRWAAFTGRYQWPEPWGTMIEIRVTDDGKPVYVELFRDQHVGLFPQSEKSFFQPLYNLTCSFERESSAGQVHLLCSAPWSDEPVRLVPGGRDASEPVE